MKLYSILVSFALALLLSSCVNDGDIKLEYEGYQPVNLDDGWVISSPEDENMDSDFLDKAYQLVYDDERFIMARSLLVLRNGKLVGEAYPNDLEDIYRIQNIQSCTKSFTSILAGIALNKGFIASVTQPLSDIYPDHFDEYPDKKDITIRDALMMRTGIEFDNDEHTLELYQREGSSVEYVLSLPKVYPAATVFHYHDGAPQLVSAAIQQGYGNPLSEFADEYLFKPLQITEWKWESAKDGVTFGAFSLYLKPRDAAKFGQLLLNNGEWNGQQLIDSAWITEATQPLATSDSYGASYGYYFWIYPAYKAYSAIGHGGQHIFIMPSKDLVIIYTAWPYTSGLLFDDFTELADLIIESCH